MSAIVAIDRPTDRPTAHRAIHCPDCGRYLAAATIGPLAVGIVWLHLHCRTCGRWAWLDAATGARRHDALTKRAP